MIKAEEKTLEQACSILVHVCLQSSLLIIIVCCSQVIMSNMLHILYHYKSACPHLAQGCSQDFQRGVRVKKNL